MTSTPQRTIRIEDDLWDRVQRVADSLPEMTVSRFIREAIREKLEREASNPKSGRQKDNP